MAFLKRFMSDIKNEGIVRPSANAGIGTMLLDVLKQFITVLVWLVVKLFTLLKTKLNKPR
tara:strand:- start:525221 stop:525400 length:180 start_codon:yes stop_codon:yes gene_type:complete